MKAKIIVCAALCVGLAGCFGTSSSNNTLIGQVKKVHSVTPIICGDRTDVDVSLGVIRGGVGSMSTQDMWLTVANPMAVSVLQYAADHGSIVKLTYDVERMTICWNNEEVTGAAIEQ